MYYLAVDIGASSGRHILGKLENGKLELTEIYRFENGIVKQNGKLVWDINKLFNDIVEGIKQCKVHGVVPYSIGIDTWGVDYALLDENGHIIDEVYSYRDNRHSEVVKAVKKVTTKPIIMKLSPNVTDIVSIAKACEDSGADGISLINTLLGMRINLNNKKPVIANKMGGFSGEAIFPVAVRMVYQVAKAVKIPVVGMGGVANAENVLEMMMAGATAVEVGAANLINPYVCKEIIEDLPRVMEKYKINSLKEIIGVVE